VKKQEFFTFFSLIRKKREPVKKSAPLCLEIPYESSLSVNRSDKTVGFHFNHASREMFTG